jgi:hypothetical protein
LKGVYMAEETSDRFDRLLSEIPAINQMREARDKTSNPALKTRAARLVFEGLESSEKDDVREFFKEVRQERNRLHAAMGQIPFRNHSSPSQAIQDIGKQRSEMKKLNRLWILFDATRPASRAEQIAETVALLREDPAGTIRSGINHVTESVLASCANRLGLARFFSTSRDHTQ